MELTDYVMLCGISIPLLDVTGLSSCPHKSVSEFFEAHKRRNCQKQFEKLKDEVHSLLIRKSVFVERVVERCRL